jgi:hypothetical protein
MISEDCCIENFMGAIEGKTYTEAIILANTEATEAERLLLRYKNRQDHECPCDFDYVDSLKEFILFIRCSVLRNRISKDRYYKLFNSYLKSV